MTNQSKPHRRTGSTRIRGLSRMAMSARKAVSRMLLISLTTALIALSALPLLAQIDPRSMTPIVLAAEKFPRDDHDGFLDNGKCSKEGQRFHRKDHALGEETWVCRNGDWKLDAESGPVGNPGCPFCGTPGVRVAGDTWANGAIVIRADGTLRTHGGTHCKVTSYTVPYVIECREFNIVVKPQLGREKRR